MSYPYTVYKTWVTGEVLTASDLNASFTNEITNHIPSSIDDASNTTTAMQTTADPYPAATPSLATALDGELQRLRYVVAQISGQTFWYVDPSSSIETIVNGVQVFAGAKSFSSAVTVSPVTNQLVLGATRTVTINAPTPASLSRVVTLPDMTADYSVVATEGAQTVNGNKTLAGTIDVTGLLKGKGSTTNDSAAAGYIGEVVLSSLTTDQSFPATTQFGNSGSITLTAGDWDVSCMFVAENNTGSWSSVGCGIGTVTGNDSTGLTRGTTFAVETFAASTTSRTQITLGIPVWRASISGSTTYFFKVSATYTSGAPTYRGFLMARRVR